MIPFLKQYLRNHLERGPRLVAAVLGSFLLLVVYGSWIRTVIVISNRMHESWSRPVLYLTVLFLVTLPLLFFKSGGRS